MEEYDDEVEAVHQSVLKKRELGSLKKTTRKKHSSSPLYTLPLIKEEGKEIHQGVRAVTQQLQSSAARSTVPTILPTIPTTIPSSSTFPPNALLDDPLLATHDHGYSNAHEQSGRLTMRRSTSPSKTRNKNYEENGTVSLPFTEDPVTYFAKNRDGPIKFVYLNKVHTPKSTVSNPYKLQMVPFKDIEKDYYTMSANGITHIRADGYSDFTPLVSWVREADLFNVISQFSVFKNYRYWKALSKWLSYVRKRRLKANRHMLEISLFTHKKIFRKYLQEVVKLCETDLLKIELLPIKPHANYSPADFVNAQNSQRRQIKDTLSNLYQMLTELVERMCTEVCDPERTKISEEDFTLKTRRKVSLRQLMLLERQKALEKSRVTDQVNSEIKMITNFIRLCDYIIVEFMVKLLLSEFSNFLAVLQTEKCTVFCTEVLFNDEGEIIFSPDCAQLKFLIHESISDLNNLLNALPRLSANNNFDKYTQLSKHRPETSQQHLGLNPKTFVLQSPSYHDTISKIDEVIDHSFDAAAVYSRNFNEFRSVHQFGKRWNIDNYNHSDPDLEIFANELTKFREWTSSLEKIQTSSTRGILFIDSKALKGSLIPIPARAMGDLKGLLGSMASDRTQKLLDLFRNSIKQLSSEPTSLEEFVDFVEFLVPLPAKSAQCGQVIQLIDDIYALLDEYDASVNPSELEKHSLIHTIFGRFKESLTTAQGVKQKLFPSHLKTLEKHIAAANATVEAINARLSAEAFSEPASPTKSLLLELADIRVQATEIKGKVEKYAKWQSILGLPSTEVTQAVNLAAAKQDKTQSMWETVDRWQQLMDSYNTMPFTSLNKADIARDIDGVVTKLSTLLSNDPKNVVGLNLMERVDQYKKILPSILELANASIKSRHWSKLFEAVGRPYDEETVFSLAQLTEYNILSHKDLISEISALATGEYELENKLRTIEEVWETAKVQIVPHHSNAKSVFVLAGVSSLLATACEHEVVLTNMLSSEYIVGIQKDVEGMKNKLGAVVAMLDEWQSCQQKWESLVPIFAQYEVQRQLSAQTNKFRVVDRRWRATIRNAQRDPRVLSITSSSGLMSTLVEANKVMSGIIQDLDSYLDSKRAVFPRFFFLTNEDLFALVSKIHAPNSIQHYFGKCFDSVKSLTFNNDCSEVLGMVSRDNEELKFETAIPLEDKLVETWLSASEEAMRKTMRELMNRALLEYNRVPLLDWIGSYPSQIIFTVIQIVWTRNVHIALDKEDPTTPLQLYEDFLRDRLESLAEASRTAQLSPLQRIIIHSIMTIDQHCFSVTHDLLARHINSSHAFEWTRHLRFYWDDKKHTCYIKQANNTLPYGYEFLGLIPRECVTTGTERYSLVFTDSFRSALGCVVQGSDEKVEMIRELARSIGRLFASFCGSTTVPSHSILRFLCAVAQVGAWGCFLGFDTMKYEVQSQACQYLNSIYLAISERTEKLVIENKTIRVDENCGLFLVLSSDQKIELPEPLKRLFRPVSILQPSSNEAIKVSLTCSGFKADPEEVTSSLLFLHEELTNLFPHLAQSMSLRAIRSIILLAGSIRRKIQTLPELDAILSAVNILHLPKFSTVHDRQLFRHALSVAFPSALVDSSQDSNDLRAHITTVIQNEFNHSSPALVEKVMELYTAMCSNNCVILVGGAQTGKSTCYNILRKVLPLWTEEKGNALSCSDVKTHIIYPNALSDAELYGEYDSSQQSWSEGLIQHVLTRHIIANQDEHAISTDVAGHLDQSSTSAIRHWMIFDGPLQGSWLLPMHYFLDQMNPCLSLPSGDKISFPNSMHVLFESPSLQCSCPGMIGKSVVVAFSEETLGWYAMYATWFHSFNVSHGQSVNIKKTLGSLVDEFIAEALEFTKHNCGTSLFRPSDKNLVQSFCFLFDKFFKEVITPPSAVPTTPTTSSTPTSISIASTVSMQDQQQQQPIEISVRAVFLFALVWSIGGYLHVDDRLVFDKWLKAKLDAGKIWGITGDNLTVYDYGFDPNYYGRGAVVKGWNRLHLGGGQNLSSSFSSSVALVTPTIRPSISFPSLSSKALATDEVLRMSTLLPPLLQASRPVLLVGPRGSGKSTIISHIAHTLTKKGYYKFPVNLSPLSSSASVEEIIEVGMERKLKNVIGAPLGKTAVAFITSMDQQHSSSSNPKTEQNTSEWFRQLLTHKRFYKRKDHYLVSVKDLTLVGSLDVTKGSGAGEDVNSLRLIDHFHVLYVPSASDSSIKSTLIPLLKNFLLAFDSPELLQMGTQLVESSLTVLRALSTMLLPSTTTRAHYHFGYGDLVRVFKSILHYSPTTKSDTLPKFLLLKLWKHEMTRVFCDRLVDMHDRELFQAQMRHAVESHFGMDVLTLEDVVFGDFSRNKSEPEYYEHLPSHVKNLLKVTVDDDTSNYSPFNASNAAQQVVLLSATVNHIAHLVSTFRKDQGHTLLLGAPGSGKVQTARLAARLIGYDCHIIAPSSNVYNDEEFTQELKRVIISSASANDKPIVIICKHETLISNDQFLERIHSFLDIELLSLVFHQSEISTIVQEVRLEALASGRSSHPDDILTYFLENIRRNVHIVLCLNPQASDFSEKMLKFPGLTKLMSVDWFMPWGQDDLYTMGSGLLKSEPGNLDFSLSVEPICQMFIFIHNYAGTLSKQATHLNHILAEPPTDTFIELVKTFLNIFKKKREDTQRRLVLLKSALKKIEDVRRDTETIELELAATKPQLAKAMEDTTKLEDAIAKNSKVVSDFWKVVHAEEMAVSVKGTETAYLEAEAQKAQDALDAHLPVLSAALYAVQSLSKQELAELKTSLPSPPDRLARVMEALCILKDIKSTSEEIKRMLAEPDLDWFTSFDKNKISQDTQNKLKKLIQHPEFTPNGMEPKSARVFCSWIIAIHKYAGLYEGAAPKREKVSDSSTKLDQSQKVLKEKREALALVEEKLAQFNKVFKASNDKKEKLERKVQSLSTRLNRSERLSTSLQGSAETWQGELKQHEQVQEDLVSYSLVVAGFVVYLGMHGAKIRQEALQVWKAQCVKVGLRVVADGEVAVQSTVDASQLRLWHRVGLPKDMACVQNAILTTLSARWPLLVDPHGIARKWIKGTERSNQLRILSPNQPDFVRVLENSVATGRVVYIDHAVSDDGLLPSVLDDLLRPIANSSNLPPTVRIVNEVNYNKKFKLYLATRLSQPNLQVHLRTRVNIVDFNVGRDVIESQLLAYVLRHDIQQQQPTHQKETKEKGARERESDEALIERDKEQEYQEHHDHLLMALASAEGDVLDNETLVTMMMQTRLLMAAINPPQVPVDGNAAVEFAAKDQDDEKKENFKAIAQRGALLYEIISSLHLLNPLYQFSLHHFTSIFKSVILKSPPASAGIDSQARTSSLLVKLNQAVFAEVGKGLFMRHRKVFAFLLATRIQQQAGYISNSEWTTLVEAATHHELSDLPATTPPQELVGLVSWNRITHLDNLVHGLAHSFTSFPGQWKQFIESNDYLNNPSPLPDGWDDKITVFQRLLVLLATCPHKVMPEIYDFINKQLGVQFNSPDSLELDRALIASAPLIPIVIITPHSRDVDTLANLSKFVHEQGKSEKFVSISLGTDAEKLGQHASTVILSQALTQGNWVFVHHINRNPAWLVNVENLLESAASPAAAAAAAAAATLSTSILPPKTTAGTSNYAGLSLHSDFRLWLHCVEHLDSMVPITLLQKGIKLTLEQPTTIRTILAQIYSRMDERLFSSASKKMAPLFRKLVFVLCFFHASILVRNEYPECSGGWGRKFQFSENDLALGIETIRSKIVECEERNEELTFPMLQYSISEVIYGGHASTVWEMDSLREILTDLLLPLAQDKRATTDEKFSLPALPSSYASPPDSTLGLEAYLRTLPLYDSALAVGLGENVSRDFLQEATRNFLVDLASLSSSDRTCSPHPDLSSIITQLENCMLPFTSDKTPAQSPVSSDTLLVTAQRECSAIAVLLSRVLYDLRLLVTAGAAASIELLQLSRELLNGTVPTAWTNCSEATVEWTNVTSLITPIAWLSHISQRWAFFRSWLQSLKVPAPIPMDYFTTPKCIFSSIIHSYAQKRNIRVDSVVLEYSFCTEDEMRSTSIDEGVFLAGAVLVGAKWSDARKSLEPTSSCDPTLSSVYIRCCPTERVNLTQTTTSYLCPLFFGWKSTTDFLVTCIPVSSSLPASVWIKRGVRMHILSNQ